VGSGTTDQATATGTAPRKRGQWLYVGACATAPGMRAKDCAGSMGTWSRRTPTWACPLCIELLGQQAARVAAEGWQGCAAARERNAQARRVEQARPGAPTRRSSADRGCQRRREAEETKGAGAPEKHRSGCHVQRGAGSSSAAPGRARAGTMRPGGNAGVKAPLEPKWLELIHDPKITRNNP
jgi:hypothetical protein